MFAKPRPPVSFSAKAKTVRLSLADQELVAELLCRPPKTSPALERAFEAHRRLIRTV